MTRPLDTQALREALRASRGAADAVDVAMIIERGRRLRWQRRVAVAAGGMCVVLALAAAATSIERVTSQPPGLSKHLVPAQPGPATNRAVPRRAAPPTPRPGRTGNRSPAPATSTPASASPTPQPTWSAPAPRPTRSAPPPAGPAPLPTVAPAALPAALPAAPVSSMRTGLRPACGLRRLGG